MARNNAANYINGTEAFKIDAFESKRPRFVAYPGANLNGKCAPKFIGSSKQSTIKSRLVDIAERSEMLCSLALEDWRGVVFNRISKHDAIIFGMATSVLAAISIALGA